MKNTLFILILFILISCKNDNLEERVFKDVLYSSKQEIDLKNYTDFEWDTLFMFHKITNLENIESVIGKKYNNYEEFTRPLIFIKKGKIVYSINRKSNFEGLTNEQFIYENGNYSLKTKADSKFKVAIKDADGIKYLLISDQF